MGQRGRNGRQAAKRAEDARRQAEALRRQQRRHRITAVIVLVVIAAVVFGLYRYDTAARGVSPEAAAQIAKAPAAAVAAGCSPVRVVPPYDPESLDRAHIGATIPAAPPLSSYPSTPPASGPHDPVPLDAGVYTSPPGIYHTIHSLEHGAVIVWLAPDARGDADAIRSFFARPAERDHVIVAPYDYPRSGEAGSLPAGQTMALVAWHRLQACSQPSLPVAAAFVARFATRTLPFPVFRPRGYQGDAPEAGLAI